MVDLKKLANGFMHALLDGHARGIYIGDAVYKLHYRKGYQLRQMPGYSRNSAGSWTWKKFGGKIHLDLSSEPNPHVLIVGSSGYGKSTLIKVMLHEFGKTGMPIVVFDGHNEHEKSVIGLGGHVYDATRYGINIFATDHMRTEERIDSVSRLLKDVYGLGYVQEATLRQCLLYTYRKRLNRISGELDRAPTMNDLVREINIFIMKSKSTAEVNRLKQIRSRILLLSSGSFSGNVSVDMLMHSISSFSLSGMNNEESMAIYMHELLKRIYTGMKYNEKEAGIRIIVIIDEADALLDRQSPASGIISRLISEGRKYGVGVIIATHNASRLEPGITSNLSTVIAFRPRDPSDINYISNMFAYSDPDKASAIRNRLSGLGQHVAMLVNYRISKPVIFKGRYDAAAFKEVPERGMPEYSSANVKGFILDEARKPIKVEALREEARKRYGDRSLREIEDMLSGSELVSFEADDGIWVGVRSNPGIEHETMVMKIGEKLKNMGIMSYILDNSNGPDIIANVSGKKIAVEYETGSKTIQDSIGMLSRRSAKYKTTLVVTNEPSLAKYKGIAKELGNGIHVCLYKDITKALLGSII